MHYENDVCGSPEGSGFFHNFNSHKSIQLTDPSNLTMTRCSPKELPLDFCWLHWLMPETKGSQYLLRQTFAKIHPSTLTRCFLHNCLNSLEDKIISFVQLPLLKWHKKLYGRNQPQDWQKERDETTKCAQKLKLWIISWGRRKRHLTCAWAILLSILSEIILSLFETVLWLTAQPRSVCWLGTVHTLTLIMRMLSHSSLSQLHYHIQHIGCRV